MKNSNQNQNTNKNNSNIKKRVIVEPKRINVNQNQRRVGQINQNRFIQNRANNMFRVVNRNINRRFNNIRRNINNTIKANNPKSINLDIEKEGKNMVISGKDLIVSNNVTNINKNGILAVIPINPVYWENTRIKNLAALNQYYIPISIQLEYVPIVSKFQKGNITIGTIANSTMDDQNIQNVLISSTSGISFSCASNFTKQIDVKSIMAQRKMLVSAKVDKESIPFYIVIYLNEVIDDKTQELINPGQFYIKYMFKFFNPISHSINFKSVQNGKISSFDPNYANITIFLTEQNRKFKIGTIIDIESYGNEWKYVYNGSQIQLDLDKNCLFLYSEADSESPLPPVPEVQTYSLDHYEWSGSGQTYILTQDTPWAYSIDTQENKIEIFKIDENLESLHLTVNNGYVRLFNNALSDHNDFPDTISQYDVQLRQLWAAPNYDKLIIYVPNVNWTDIPNLREYEKNQFKTIKYKSCVESDELKRTMSEPIII